MIENIEAYNTYQRMLDTFPTIDLLRGCGARVNKAFINAALTFGTMKAANPFEVDTIAYNHFNDLVYFATNTSYAHDCPFRMRCADVAVKLIQDNNMQNPYKLPEEEEKEEEPAEVWQMSTDEDQMDDDWYTTTVELDPPEQIQAVVPEKKNRWHKRKG